MTAILVAIYLTDHIMYRNMNEPSLYKDLPNKRFWENFSKKKKNSTNIILLI